MMLAELLLAASMECPIGGVPLEIVLGVQTKVGFEVVDLVDLPQPAAADQILILKNGADNLLLVPVVGNCADTQGLSISRDRGIPA